MRPFGFWPMQFAVNWIFGKKILKNIFCFSSLILKCIVKCIVKYIVKISEIWPSGTCWKSASKVSTLSIFAYFAAIFTMGKLKIFAFFNQWLEWRLLCIGSYDKYCCCLFFSLNDPKCLQIFIFCVKCHAKKKKKKKKKKKNDFRKMCKKNRRLIASLVEL